MIVRSDTLLASPTHQRRILTFWGVQAPLATIPTEDSTQELVCAANSAIDAVEQGYHNFIVGYI